MDYKEKSMIAYEKACDMVKLLFNFMNDKKLVKSGFDVTKALNNFDVLVQYSLLEVALSDQKFDVNELRFISKFHKFYSLMDYLNDLGFKDVTWQKLYNIEFKTLALIMEKVRPHVQLINKDFVEYISLIDAYTPSHDYAKELYDEMITVISGVIISDRRWKHEEGSFVPLIIEAILLIRKKKKNIKK